MGTLDDAIRQHLELKRRGGAADAEVDKLESEAFGPARREPAQAAPPAPPESLPVEAHDVPPPPVEVATPEADPVPVAEEDWLDDEPEVPPVAPAQPTREFSADDLEDASGDAPASDYVAPDDEGEDLLEETPEFLQETPEHDRLWFEQKPPRNFDFDQ